MTGAETGRFGAVDGSRMGTPPVDHLLVLSVDNIEYFFLVAAALFMLLALAMFYRAVKGPTTQDRVLAVNVLGTNTVVVLALLAVGLGESSLLDMALIYALLNFLMAVAISKFTVERGGVL